MRVICDAQGRSTALKSGRQRGERRVRIMSGSNARGRRGGKDAESASGVEEVVDRLLCWFLFDGCTLEGWSRFVDDCLFAYLLTFFRGWDGLILEKVPWDLLSAREARERYDARFIRYASGFGHNVKCVESYEQTMLWHLNS
jgi:hypothetical protein